MSILDHKCRYSHQGTPWPTCDLGVDMTIFGRIIDRPCIEREPDDRRISLPQVCDKREPMTQADKDEYMAPFAEAIKKLADGVSPCCGAPTQVMRLPGRDGHWTETTSCTKCGEMCMHSCGGGMEDEEHG